MHRPSHRARPSLAVVVAIAVPIMLSGCASASDGDDMGASSQPSSSPSAEPTSSDAQAIDTSDWLEYSTHDGDMTYRYPADWALESESVQSVEESERWFDDASLVAANGQTLLRSADFVDIGGYCDAPMQGTLLHSEPADVDDLDGEPAMIAVVAFDGPPAVFAMGITSAAWIAEDGQFGCPFYFVFRTSDGGVSMGTHFQVSSDDPLWVVDSLEDAQAYMETDEYATLLEILRSVETS